MSNPKTYTTCGKTFHFNDHVIIESLRGVPLERRTGRLVQIRKGAGAFGSDILMIRLRDKSLACYENVLVFHVGEDRLLKAFYGGMGIPIPEIPDQPPLADDSPETSYTIKHKYRETGFLIETPKQPASSVQSFACSIRTASPP